MSELSLFKRLDKKQFYFRLSSLLSAGHSLISAISEMEKSTFDSETLAILKTIKHFLLSGKTLSEAMVKIPVFTPIEITTISAGIKSGNLAESLSYLSDYFTFYESIRRNIKESITYPLIILNLAIFIPALPVLFLKGFLFFILRILPSLIFIYGIFTCIFFFYRLAKNKRNEILLKIPVVGKLIIAFSILNFLKTFIVLYRAGVDIVNAYNQAVEIIENKVIKEEFKKNLEILKQGKSISDAIKRNVFVPNEIKEMIETGSISGKLDEVVEKAIEYKETEIKHLLKQILTVLPVFVFLIIALYVGYIIISFYSEYLKTINSLIKY